MLSFCFVLLCFCCPLFPPSAQHFFFAVLSNRQFLQFRCNACAAYFSNEAFGLFSGRVGGSISPSQLCGSCRYSRVFGFPTRAMRKGSVCEYARAPTWSCMAAAATTMAHVLSVGLEIHFFLNGLSISFLFLRRSISLQMQRRIAEGAYMCTFFSLLLCVRAKSSLCGSAGRGQDKVECQATLQTRGG